MLGVLDGFNEIGVAPGTTAILRWGQALPTSAGRIDTPGIPGQHLLQPDIMLPRLIEDR